MCMIFLGYAEFYGLSFTLLCIGCRLCGCTTAKWKFWFCRANLRWSFLLAGWGDPALTFSSRQEGRFLSSAFLSSFLYLHISFSRKLGFLSNAHPVTGRLGSRLLVIFKSDFRLQCRDRCRRSTVVPTGLQWLRNAEARNSFMSADTWLLQACCSGTLLLLWSLGLLVIYI